MGKADLGINEEIAVLLQEARAEIAASEDVEMRVLDVDDEEIPVPPLVRESGTVNENFADRRP